MQKILVIDDSIEFCKLLHRILSMASYSAIEANGGAEGLELALQEQPDLILLDYMMPLMDGFEVFHRLRADPRTATIPVIMITAFAGDYNVDRMSALRQGIDDYLTKPISPSALTRCVADTLYRHGSRLHTSPLPMAPGMPELRASMITEKPNPGESPAAHEDAPDAGPDHDAPPEHASV